MTKNTISLLSFQDRDKTAILEYYVSKPGTLNAYVRRYTKLS